MSEIKCLVCGGKYFRKGYYDIDVDVKIYSTAYNDVRTRSDVHVDVVTSIDHEINESGEISFKIKSEEPKTYYGFNNDDSVDTYKYVCEECGFIMSFTQKKTVGSKFEEKKRKQEENTLDWSDFGK